MTFLVLMFKALTEIALMLLVGQGTLALLAGPRRADNPVYRMFEIATRPVVLGTRAIMPRAVPGAWLPFLGFVLLALLWCLLTAGKIYLLRIAPASGG